MRGLAALAWRSLPSLQAQRSNPYRGMEKAGLLRFARNDVEGFEFQTARRPHSRGMICPSCTISFRPKREGAGNAGCLLHLRSRVQDALKKCAHEHTGTDGAFRRSLRNGLTAYAALSPATNSSCHRRRRISGSSKPGWISQTSAGLTPATGARTTRLPYAASTTKNSAKRALLLR